MPDLHRRTLLRGAAVAAGGAVLGGPFIGFVARGEAGAVGRRPAPDPTLGPVPDLRDGTVRLHLPDGFQYRSFHDTEFPVTLDDGTRLPGRHDGMGAFRGPDGTVRLVRNHEVNNPGPAFGDAAAAYDPMAQGGTTTVEVTRHGEVRRSWTSLNGTMMNCSGGRMPWGSWITCEETVNGPDVGPDFTGTSNVPLTQPHGFVYEVPADGQSDRAPITAAGRFAHESVAYDPRGGHLYLTEDNFGYPSGFYRYTPPVDPMRSGRLADGGRLQMLAVRGRRNLNLAAAQRRHATYPVQWVDIDDPAPRFPYTPGQAAPTTNDQALTYVSRQGWDRGAAYFSRLEGSAYDDGVVYFTATQGGGPAETSTGPVADGFGNGHGQVWGYDCRAQVLRLVYESPGPDVLDFPDNVTTSPRGTLVVCEDNVNDNYVRGLTPRGDLFDIALNRLVSSTGADRSNDEFAGSTFSPDGHTLFVNIQASRGMTFAIWGDWSRIGV
ncbi:PhoX family protein [Micromonospora sp. A3M-1-15]|uniref:PhoX family protein n=1 Tax=Micromonospora sp. A3M-1-15 TaxID=2962035 RepID=UPI0020B7640F|nr:alkaline phosphatase PhoX [Micromonospora sp. A3M-1-15]MCP3786962.1 PhoX family protein [Micromonospora sp. A3M-1-15]